MLQKVLVVAAVCAILVLPANAELVDCSETAVFGGLGNENFPLAGLVVCGYFTETDDGQFGVLAPSNVSASSVLTLLDNTPWPSPMSDADLSTMQSASLALFFLAPTEAGTNLNFTYVMTFDGVGYGEIGFTSCPIPAEFLGIFEMGPGEGMDTRLPDICLSADDWTLIQLAGGTEAQGGNLSVPLPSSSLKALYLMAFSEGSDDPLVLIGDLRVEPIPEPSTAWMLLGGLIGLAWRLRKKTFGLRR